MTKKYSQLRDPARPSLEKLLPLSFPLSMYIETTNHCNFLCRYCPMSLPDYVKVSGGFKTMSMEDFKKISSDIKEGGKLKVLRFYLMGEPLMNARLPAMIALTHELKLAERTELTTNAFFLDEKKSQALVDSGLDYLRVSISAVDQVRHANITQTKIKVSHIYDKVKRFKEIRESMKSKKPFLYVKMINAYNETENNKFLEMYNDVSDEAVIENPMNWDSYNNYDFLEATYSDNQISTDPQLNPYPKEVCPFPFYTLVVNVNGDVTVCCVDWNKATCVGNVFKESLKSIWEGDALRSFRRMHIQRKRDRNASCRHCRFLYTSPDNLDNVSEIKNTSLI